MAEHPPRPSLPGHPTEELLVDLATGETVGDDVRDHVADCATCTVVVDGLSHVTDLLGGLDEPLLLTPSPQVWQRVRAATADDPPAAAGRAPAAVLSLAPARPAPGRPRRRVLALLAGGLAAGLVVGAGLGAAVLRGTTDRATLVASARLEPLETDAGPGTARLLRQDGHLHLRVDVPAAAPGADRRQVWLVEDDGSLVTLGLLDTSGPVDLPVPADAVARARAVDVSSEPSDGDPAHSGTSLYRGPLETG